MYLCGPDHMLGFGLAIYVEPSRKELGAHYFIGELGLTHHQTPYLLCSDGKINRFCQRKKSVNG